MKKLFAILMSIMMIACFMPTMAFADGETPQEALAFKNANSATYGEELTLKAEGGSTKAEVTYAITEDTDKIATLNGAKLTFAKAGTIKVTATKAGDATYAEVTETQEITVNKATVTVTAKDREIKVGETVPTLGTVKDTDYTVTGLVGNDELTNVALKYASTPNNTTAGSVAINVTATADGTKYTVSTVNAKLTVKPNTGSSGGGSYYPYTPSTPSTPSAPGLDKTKTDSTTAINAAATANKYDAAEQAEVKKILDKANADIKNAKTEAEVKAIEEAAQAEIDKILTTEEKATVAALDNVEKRDFATKSKVITRKGGKKVIRLTWTAPDGVDVDGYEIFRSTKKNSGFGKKPYFTTSNTSYTNTKDLKAGKTYYYKVRAFVVINGERVYTDYSLKANRKL